VHQQNTINDDNKIIRNIILIRKEQFGVSIALLLMKGIFLLAVLCGRGISSGGFEEMYRLSLLG
jgi:hypothetical protein